jgi:hypothetical protein
MGTQLDFSVGLAAESTWNTAVTVSRFFESEAKFKWDVKRVQGKGLRPTKGVQRLNRNTPSRFEGGGVQMVEANTRGLGILLNAVLGSVTNTLVSGGTYQQVHTLTQTDPVNSYTIQEVLPLVGGGAGQPHTFTGCVADTLDLEVKEGDIVSFKIGWLAAKLSTAIGAAATSYPATDGLFTFTQAAIAIGGTLTAPTATALASITGSPLATISDPSLSIKNNLDKKNYNAGGAGFMSRKPVLGARQIMGKFTAEYTDNVLRDAYLAKTPLTLLLTFTHDDGVSVLQIALPSILLNGDIPTSNGGDPVEVPVDFEVFDNGTAAQPIWVIYRTLDTAP